MKDEAENRLPEELEYLRAIALEFVGEDREIVGCGQVDFGKLERALRATSSGLSTAEARRRRDEHRRLLRQWLSTHERSNEPLVIGLRFVAMLLSEQP